MPWLSWIWINSRPNTNPLWHSMHPPNLICIAIRAERIHRNNPIWNMLALHHIHLASISQLSSCTGLLPADGVCMRFPEDHGMCDIAQVSKPGQWPVSWLSQLQSASQTFSNWPTIQDVKRKQWKLRKHTTNMSQNTYTLRCAIQHTSGSGSSTLTSIFSAKISVVVAKTAAPGTE